MLFPEIKAYDERRDIVILDSKEHAVLFTTQYFLQTAAQAIAEKNLFSAALAGGSTPKAVYEALASPKYRDKIDWTKTLLFFSDERSVPPDNKDSNYYMAMHAGFDTLPVKNF